MLELDLKYQWVGKKSFEVEVFSFCANPLSTSSFNSQKLYFLFPEYISVIFMFLTTNSGHLRVQR
jgi:hypothetical protein